MIMTPLIAFFILITFRYIGDIISIKSKAIVPGILVFVILLVSGVWGHILPENIVEIPGFNTQFAAYIRLMFIVDMGTGIPAGQLKRQWRTILVALGAMVGIALTVLTVGAAIFGWEMAAVAAPPISGGLVAMIEMQEAAMAAGRESLARLPVLIFVVQAIPAFFILPTLLKRVCRHCLDKKNDQEFLKGIPRGKDEKRRSLMERIGRQYKTPAFYLMQLAALAILSNAIAGVFGNFISSTVFAVLLGMFGVYFGILEKNPMERAKASGFLLAAIVMSSVSNMASSRPEEILKMLFPLVCLIVLGIIGICLMSILVGKLFKITWEMSLVIGMNCLLGFPNNYILTTEAIRTCAVDEAEEEYLTETVMPTVLIGGFTSVTVASVFFASLMKNFI